MACYYGLLVATVACVPEHLYIFVPLTRGRTHARFRGPSATCGRAVLYPCSLVVASNHYARHCARRALGIVQVSPPTPGDLKNIPKHRFLARSKLWAPSCLIRQLRLRGDSGDLWGLLGDTTGKIREAKKNLLTQKMLTLCGIILSH